MDMVRHLISPHWRPGSAALAGLLATLAYSVAMEWDKYLIGNRFNDVRFIEGILGGEKEEREKRNAQRDSGCSRGCSTSSME